MMAVDEMETQTLPPSLADLAPLETLYDVSRGSDLPLPATLAALYGHLCFPAPAHRSHIISNFVTTLDGVVSLNIPGHAGGGEISGFDRHDRMVMGLLRAVSDAVIVGTGTVRSVPHHLWTAGFICPPLTGAYQELRVALGKQEPPLTVVVSARGELDLGLRSFASCEVPVLIITTAQGAQRLREQGLPQSVNLTEAEGTQSLRAGWIVEVVGRLSQGTLLLVEEGPHLLGEFLAERCLDEQFLTLAPQIAGRDSSSERPGLVAGKVFAPHQPLWSTLTGVKRSQSHLFLRYSFARPVRYRYRKAISCAT
jgi:riboflavin biosynthesis pyrimidine reductase